MGRTVSNIPATAISAVLTPVQRQNNDAIRARQVQAAKNQHHAEDVQELDDTGVDSIRDEAQGRGEQKEQNGEGEQEAQEDKVEIEALKANGARVVVPSEDKEGSNGRLDISA
jgi:hypothetical protein